MSFWANRASPLIPQQKHKFQVVLGDTDQHAFWIIEQAYHHFRILLIKHNMVQFCHVASGAPT